MIFNSLDFFIFLPIVFGLYWLLKNELKIQNALLLVSSYVFYGWWDPRFLILIVISSIIDYSLALRISKDPLRKKLYLGLSIAVNLGFLGFFKYFNFFLGSTVQLLETLGLNANVSSLKIILPVGISFYTFQTLSYTIDVYREKLEPCKDIISFFAFVSFFPQLVAGPIERATNLLPQFYKKRKFDKALAYDGLYQMLWGFFKKIVIADNCAFFADQIFDNYTEMSSLYLILGLIYFAFQIYGDFSGYSDIAIGTAKLFGFKLMVNFSYPYFSRNIGEFWRRWHISLSTWFRDYLYIPLGGSRGNKGNQLRNVIIIFVVSGFWHGANWTYMFWGLLNGLYFIPLLLAKKNRKFVGDIVAQDSIFPTLNEVIGMLSTFSLTILAWTFFRAENISMAFSYIINIFTKFQLDFPSDMAIYIPLIIVLLVIEWFSRNKEFPLRFKNPFQFQNLAAACLIFWTIMIWGHDGEVEFIYFQF